METSAGKPPFAWQPLTPSGVAAFARAPVGRLLAVQFVVAILAAATVVWFLHVAWFPTIGEAISRLPAQGEIHAGNLDWHTNSPAMLAEGQFLAFTVDLQHTGEARSPAHIQVELGQHDFEVFSLLGFLQRAYHPGWIVPVNQPELAPWWGAWAPAILGITAGLVILCLMVTWAVLATVYALPAWLLAFFANRDLSLGGGWRLAGAALMPGALLMTAAIFCYGSGAFDLVRLALAVGAHLVLGWVYLVLASLRVPVHPEAAGAKDNPFTPTAKDPQPPIQGGSA